MPDRDRTVNAPDKEWLTRKQAAAFLNVGADKFDAIVAQFKLRPIVLGPRNHRWHWMDVVCLAHLYARLAGNADREGSN